MVAELLQVVYLSFIDEQIEIIDYTLYNNIENRMGAALFQVVYLSFILITTLELLHRKLLSSLNLLYEIYSMNDILMHWILSK